MIVDSNIIVRLIIKNNLEQFEKAKVFFEKVEKGETTAKISILVLDEIIWVLQNYYDLAREIFLSKLLQLLAYPKVKIIEVKKDVVISILEQMIGNRIDFTDYYLSAISKRNKVFSFDEDFKKMQFKLVIKN